MPPNSYPDIRESDLQRCGYTHLDVKGRRAVALDWAASAVALALDAGTLHEWAALQPEREEMRGRGVIYSVDLPTIPPTPVVIRRNRHGGLLHGLTGEYFMAPTRAPLELSISLRLAAAGIPTPEVIAYAIYPTAGIFARSDVMTRRLPVGDDLPAAWKMGTVEERDSLLAAVARLLKSLSAAGAWHADLNLKNIYIAGSGADRIAYLLDVDRVTFPGAGDVAARNFERLARSVRKWRERWGLDFDEDSLARLADLAGEKN
ncbi:MAG: lipopolysaccharide kinase InaA family protein [Desulfuromonadaceae bacterium]